ncbi:MAG TPA: hypothetical protein VF950_28175 [Planctomycetota bacterium]
MNEIALATLLLLVRDGMPLENGRFAGGPATVLSLSPDQARSLRERRTLVLSGSQRDALRRSAGRAPATLLVYDTRAGENDCGCEAVDVGLRFSPDQIEVPHPYLAEEAAPPPLVSIVAWLGVAAGVCIALNAAAEAAGSR